MPFLNILTGSISDVRETSSVRNPKSTTPQQISIPLALSLHLTRCQASILMSLYASATPPPSPPPALGSEPQTAPNSEQQQTPINNDFSHIPRLHLALKALYGFFSNYRPCSLSLSFLLSGFSFSANLIENRKWGCGFSTTANTLLLACLPPSPTDGDFPVSLRLKKCTPPFEKSLFSHCLEGKESRQCRHS